MADQDQNNNFINSHFQRTSNASIQQMEDSRELNFDALQPRITNMAKGFAIMQKRFKKLERVNDALTHFNESFGSFLYGMAVNDSVLQWPGAPTPESYQALRERLKNKAVSKELGPMKEIPSEVQPAAVKPKTISNKRKAEVQTQPTQTKRRFVVSVDIRKIINRLPLEYRDQTKQMKDMKTLLLFLKSNPNGLNLKDLAKEIGLPHHTVTACVNALLRSKDAIKKTAKGSYAVYLLDPEKYPSIAK